MNFRTLMLATTLAASALGASAVVQPAAATSPSDLTRESNEAVRMLIDSNPNAARVAKQAVAILVFPSIVKAGFVFGAAYGEGELQQGSTVDSYYNSFTGSWGLQAGAQSYGYVVFLMNQHALSYLRESHGWEIGVGPTVVVVNEGIAKNFSTSTLKDDAYAFIFDQKGLMIGISLEGSKISRINAP